MKKTATAILAAFVVLGGYVAFAKSFPDVPTTHKYYDAINALSDQGVISGYPDGTFKPDQASKRVESLKIILNAQKYSIPSSVTSLPFPDTYTSEWYAPYIYTAYNNKIVSGYPDGTFRPENTLNLAESLKMVLLAAHINPNNIYPSITTPPYNDIPLNQWFTPLFQYAKDFHLIDADSSNNVYPASLMSRGSLVEVMYRMSTNENAWFMELDQLNDDLYQYDDVENDAQMTF